MPRMKVDRVATIPLIAERPTVPETKLPLFRVATVINERAAATVALTYKQLAELMALGSQASKSVGGLAEISHKASHALFVDEDAYQRVLIVALAQGWPEIARRASDPNYRVSPTPDLVTRLDVAAAIKSELGDMITHSGTTVPVDTIVDDVWNALARLTAELDGSGRAKASRRSSG